MRIASADQPVTFYNLEVVISAGYRVNSIKEARCRQWATQVLRQYLVQGYTLQKNALVALTLLIAKSRPEDKSVIATLVVNLTSGEN